MPFGTASHRLRVLVMFSLIQRLGENRCAKCSETIVSADDLSIEHIVPWEGVSATLFWNLDNIAFSHRACNRPIRFRGHSWCQENCPDGHAWCSRHRAYLLRTSFPRNTTRPNGLNAYCRDCLSLMRRERNKRDYHSSASVQLA
jgi:hypothetical protein